MLIIRGLMGMELMLARNSRILMQVTAHSFSLGQTRPASATSVPDTSKVSGLSKKVVDVPNEPVGPGAAKDKPYKNPEYFCYNTTSYFEAEVEMAKYRLPQPSNQTPLK